MDSTFQIPMVTIEQLARLIQLNGWAFFEASEFDNHLQRKSTLIFMSQTRQVWRVSITIQDAEELVTLEYRGDELNNGSHYTFNYHPPLMPIDHYPGYAPLDTILANIKRTVTTVPYNR